MTSSGDVPANGVEKKQILRSMFDEVFGRRDYDEQSAARYFHPTFRQSVDGKELDYQGFLRHLKAVKNAVREVAFEYKSLVAEGNIVFSNHIVRAIGHDGRKSETHVVAEFCFLDGRIVSCDELTRTLEAESVHAGLGSLQ